MIIGGPVTAEGAGADAPAEPAEVAAPHTNESRGPAAMMTITELRGSDYLLRSVADGVEDYFMGAGKRPARLNVCVPGRVPVAVDGVNSQLEAGSAV
jgi:hypothetical protein